VSTAPPATGADDWRRFARRDWCRLHLLLAAGDAPGADMLLQQALEEYLKA
jgi:hypothetical protein